MEIVEKLEELKGKIEKYCGKNSFDIYELRNFRELIEDIEYTLKDNSYFTYIMLNNKLENYTQLFKTYKKQHRQNIEILTAK